jgi:hypothetical protein
MSEPEEIRFACIGCGALNPAGAEACSGCGHRFREPTPVPSPPVSPANFYEAPRSRVDRAPTFRIGTAMVLIAVVAFCLGAFAAGIGQGVLVTMGLLPATIRTFLVAGWREAEGRPMSTERKVLTFISTIGGLILIAVSSIIAFGVTCFPIGMSGGDAGLAIGAGLLSALGAAIGLTWALLRAGRAGARREQDRESIRWR